MKKSIAIVSASLGLLSAVSPCSQVAAEFMAPFSPAKPSVSSSINTGSSKVAKNTAVSIFSFSAVGVGLLFLTRVDADKSSSVLTPKKSGGEVVSKNGKAEKSAPAVEVKKDPKALAAKLKKLKENIKPKEPGFFGRLFRRSSNSFSYDFVSDFVNKMNEVSDLKDNDKIYKVASEFLIEKFKNYGFEREGLCYTAKTISSYDSATECYKKEFSFSEHTQCAIYRCGCKLLNLIIDKLVKAGDEQKEEEDALGIFTKELGIGDLIVKNGYGEVLNFINKELFKVKLA